MASYTAIDNWLPESDPVVAMKDTLGVTRATVIGGLMLFWRKVNREAIRVGESDDMLLRATAESIDSTVELPGFTAAMPDCWLAESDTGYIIPDYWPRCDQRTRAIDAARKAARRAKNADVRVESVGIRRNPVTTPTPTPTPTPKQQISSAGADASAKKTATKTDKKPRKPNPIWDALEPLFFPSGVSKSDAKRMGKACRDLKAKGAMPDEIRLRHAQITALDWNNTSIEGFAKNWDILAVPGKTASVFDRFKDKNGDFMS